MAAPATCLPSPTSGGHGERTSWREESRHYRPRSHLLLKDSPSPLRSSGEMGGMGIKVALSKRSCNNGRGVLAIATGGGKTKAALIAATLLQDQQPDRPFLLVVLVPSDPLVRQWAEEVRGFGVTPTLIGDIPSDRRAGVIARSRLLSSPGASGPRRSWQHFSSLIRSTIPNACRPLHPPWRDDARRHEAHNFGVPSFINNPPGAFEIRLGLSATPVRQYDLDGTNALFKTSSDLRSSSSLWGRQSRRDASLHTTISFIGQN